MIPKITYLFGAGASAQALPTIGAIKKGKIITPGLSSALVDFSHKLFLMGFDANHTKKSLSIKTLAKNCEDFKTPDLYAKFLLETGDVVNYKRLKILISLFFYSVENPFATTINNQIPAFDFRALQFLVTLTNNKELPKNVKVISWNYDNQIETAAARLKLSDTFTSWPNDPAVSFEDDYFLLHLNGISGYTADRANLIDDVFKKKSFDSTLEPMLSFAWEDGTVANLEPFFSNRIQHLQHMIKGTNILVVIGYSFPFFNRNIDKQMIEIIKPSLNKIYYQDNNKKRTGEFLIDQFALDPDNVFVTHIKDVSQYFIPYEL